jgi:hypothetical protein
VLGQLEDLAVIGALALEHRAGIMQGVAEHMQPGVRPRHKLAIHPDEAVALIVRNDSH